MRLQLVLEIMNSGCFQFTGLQDLVRKAASCVGGQADRLLYFVRSMSHACQEVRLQEWRITSHGSEYTDASWFRRVLCSRRGFHNRNNYCCFCQSSAGILLNQKVSNSHQRTTCPRWTSYISHSYMEGPPARASLSQLASPRPCSARCTWCSTCRRQHAYAPGNA